MVSEVEKALRDRASNFGPRGICLSHLVFPQGLVSSLSARFPTLSLNPATKRPSGSGSLSGWALWGREGRSLGSLCRDRTPGVASELRLLRAPGRTHPHLQRWGPLHSRPSSATWRVWLTSQGRRWTRSSLGPAACVRTQQRQCVPCPTLSASGTPACAAGIH